jgi:hypothetical protein
MGIQVTAGQVLTFEIGGTYSAGSWAFRTGDGQLCFKTFVVPQ